MLPPRPGQPLRPVPERAGEPSPFKHVIYVIKENRSYDQILGDMPEGNGDASLCIFGEEHTPNQHKIAREFVLLDNTYCSGVQSADGHQWTDSAIANEYVERQLTSDTPRSYPGAKAEDGVDALAWASSGFIWDNALAHGKTFRNYGEWMLSQAGWKDPKRKKSIKWQDYWTDFQTGAGATQIRSRAGLASLRPYSYTNTVGWDLKVPDVVRAAEFIRDLRRFETNGDLPELIILFLPNDHSGGARSEYPTPGAQLADNDLALGRVVRGPYPQPVLAGHVPVSHRRRSPGRLGPRQRLSHHLLCRQPVHQASADYQRPVQPLQPRAHHRVDLGLCHPMNQLDATATPMSDCFTATPDLTPFTSVPNRVPLDRINPDPKKIADRVLRQDAIVSNRLPLDEPDRCPEDLLNRILWRAMKGTRSPYPEWAVKWVEDDD